MEGRRASVRARELRRLLAHCPVVQSTLDLHGMRLDEAHQAVGRLLQQPALRGGVVLLIHGRGKRSPGGRSVLRAEIAGWLTEGPYARRVAAFVTAPPALGGRGALLVLVSKE
jgi:DNA-nicking Smr family endonuclease